MINFLIWEKLWSKVVILAEEEKCQEPEKNKVSETSWFLYYMKMENKN